MEEKLNQKGWHLTAVGQEQCMDNGDKLMTVDSVIARALNLDLRAIGQKWLPVDVCSGRITGDYVEGPAVMQILKLRNVSAPKDNEESQAAPRLWKITLTDGQANVAAVCLQPLKNLSLATPPGTKLLLEGRVDIKNGYLLLTHKNARLLGGRVLNLVESWQLKRTLAQQSRYGIQSEGGPPPFVPFGKKVSNSKPQAPHRDDFKSLAAGRETEEEENSEFQQQRQATIAEAEALTAKPKSFGGGQKSLVKDSDLARIVEMGFTSDQASSVLRQSGGNVTEAIGKLVGGHVESRGEDYRQERTREGGRGAALFKDRGDKRERYEQREDGEKNSRRGGRREGGRRGRGGEEEEDSVSSRPSGPATLFDFLETKIPSKSDNQKGGSKQRPTSSGQAPKYMSDPPVDPRPQTASGDSRPSQRTPSQTLNGGEDAVKHRQEAGDGLQGASHTSDRGTRSSNRGWNDSHSSTQLSNSTQSGNNRGKNYKEDRKGQGGGSDENRPRQNKSAQQGRKPGPDSSSRSHQPANANRSEREDRHLYSDNRQNRGDPHTPRFNQNNPQSLREKNGSVDHRSSDGRQDRPQFQPWPSQSDSRADYQRNQIDPGQKANINQKGRQHRQHVPRWRRGQMVLAKYWEDNQLYRAVVEAMAENGSTAVVTFVDYGNQEEVLCSDIHPLQPQSNQNDNYSAVNPSQGYFGDPRNVHMPPPYLPAGDVGFSANCIPKMEFRRGGSGPAYQHQERDARRQPTQNFYTPPNWKK